MGGKSFCGGPVLFRVLVDSTAFQTAQGSVDRDAVNAAQKRVKKKVNRRIDWRYVDWVGASGHYGGDPVRQRFMQFPESFTSAR